jgi:hypothetical protein
MPLSPQRSQIPRANAVKNKSPGVSTGAFHQDRDWEETILKVRSLPGGKAARQESAALAKGQRLAQCGSSASGQLRSGP